MRVLLDACVPQNLRKVLPGHDVQSAKYARLDGLADAELVVAADALFDALVTCDRSLRWQQSLRGRSVAVVVLVARSNRIVDLLPLVPQLIEALETIKPGEVREVGSA